MTTTAMRAIIFIEADNPVNELMALLEVDKAKSKFQNDRAPDQSNKGVFDPLNGKQVQLGDHWVAL